MIDLVPLIVAAKDLLAANNMILSYLICLGALGVAYLALRVVLAALEARQG